MLYELSKEQTIVTIKMWNASSAYLFYVISDFAWRIILFYTRNLWKHHVIKGELQSQNKLVLNLRSYVY